MARKKTRKREPAETAPADQVEVELVKAHTHAGIEYGPGERIEVRPEQAEWLRALGVAR